MNRSAKIARYLLALSFLAFSVAAQAPEPLEIKLTTPKNLIVGERPDPSMQITNVSDKPTEFVRPLDGSWHHWRYPHISVKVTDENGNTCTLELAGRCGNMDPIVADDIRRLNPGARETVSRLPKFFGSALPVYSNQCARHLVNIRLPDYPYCSEPAFPNWQIFHKLFYSSFATCPVTVRNVADYAKPFKKTRCPARAQYLSGYCNFCSHMPHLPRWQPHELPSDIEAQELRNSWD